MRKLGIFSQSNKNRNINKKAGVVLTFDDDYIQEWFNTIKAQSNIINNLAKIDPTVK